jgi:hypothetical protein
VTLRRFDGKVHRGKTSWWHGVFKTDCGLRVRTRDTRGVWFVNRPSCGMCLAVGESGL